MWSSSPNTTPFRIQLISQSYASLQCSVHLGSQLTGQSQSKGTSDGFSLDMGDSPRNSSGGQTTEAAVASPGAAPLSFRTQHLFLGRPAPRLPSGLPVATSGLLLAQVARRPRPRWSRPSPTRRINSSSEARRTPVPLGQICHADTRDECMRTRAGQASRPGSRAELGLDRTTQLKLSSALCQPISASRQRGNLALGTRHRRCVTHGCHAHPPLMAGCPPGSGEDDLRKVPAPTRPQPAFRSRVASARAAEDAGPLDGCMVVPGRGGVPVHTDSRVVGDHRDPWFTSSGLRGARRGGGGLHHAGRQPQRNGLRLRLTRTQRLPEPSP